MNFEEVIVFSYSWAKQFSFVHNEALEISTQQSSECSSSGIYFYLNIGDFVHAGSSFFVASGVIRDGKENWILGHNRFLKNVPSLLLGFGVY